MNWFEVASAMGGVAVLYFVLYFLKLVIEKTRYEE